MKRIPFSAQKTDAIIFPADGTLFPFFGPGSPSLVHCFDAVTFPAYIGGSKFRLLLQNAAKNQLNSS